MRVSKEEFRETMLRLLAQRRERSFERHTRLELEALIVDEKEYQSAVEQLSSLARNGYLRATRI
jgi:hypothetical protein